MATRVNTKFVILLAACIIALVGAVGAFYVLTVSRSASRFMAQGDELLDRGELRLAMERYQRAVAKEPSNPETLRRFIATVPQVPAKDVIEARTFLGQTIEAKRQLSEALPTDLDVLHDLYSHLLRLADEIGGRYWTDELHRQASAKLASYPDNRVAQRFHAIAQVRRIGEQMPREEVEEASQRLLAALEADPNDVQAGRHLASWMLFEAGRLARIDGDQERIDTLRAQALELSRRVAAVEPQNPTTQLYRVDVLLHPQLNQADHQAEAAEVMAEVEAQLLATPEPMMAVARAVDLLPRVDPEIVQPGEGGPSRAVRNGTLRGERLLRAALRKEEGNLLFRTMLGKIYQDQGRTAEASEQYAAVWQSRPQLPAEQMVRAQDLRVMSGVAYADLVVGEADTSVDPAVREAKLAEAEAILRDVVDITSETAPVRLVRGKIALARRQWVPAMQHLDKAAEDLRGTQQELEATLLSARARQLAGEPGAATAQLERVAAQLPDASPLRLQLAELYNQSRQFARAEAHIAAVLERDPGNVDAAKLRAQALAMQNRTDEAIAAFERIDAEAHPEVTLPLAGLYLAQGQAERARPLLEAAFAANPRDVRVLNALIRLEQDPAARQAMLARAREAGGSEQALAMLDLQLQAQAEGEEIDQEELIQQFIGAQEDPVRRTLTQARILAAQGKVDEAERAIADAEKADPKLADEPGVVELRFELAIQAQAWDKARSLAARAEALDLDRASGAFFRGRLASAQGNHSEAAAEYRRGLSARPVFSDGWRRLGEAQAQAGDRQGAAESFRRAMEQRPDNVRAIKGLAAVADSEGDHARALQLLREALPVAGNDQELIQAYLQYEAQHGNRSRAIELRRQMAEQNPANAQNRHELARLLAADGKGDEAVAMLEAQIAEEGPTLESLAVLAQVHGAAGDPARGEQILASYVQSKGASATPEEHVTLARYRLVTGDVEGAVAAYEPARAGEDPESRPITRELADVLFSRGLNEQAMPLYRELHAEDAEDAVVGLRLAETLLRLGRADEAGGIIARFPDRSESKMLMAMIARTRAAEAARAGDEAAARQRRQEALRLFEEVARADAGNAMVRLQWAVTLAEDPTQLRRVRELLDEALELNPRMADARVALADLHLREGRANDAVREYRVLVDQQPRNASARARLADLLLTTGDVASAEIVLREGARLEPENPVYPQLIGRLAMSTGDRGKATEAARQALEIRATPETLLRYTDLLIGSGRAEQAEELFKEHIELVNAEPVLQGLRGVALAKSGRTDEARALFARAIQRTTAPAQLGTIARQMVQAFDLPDALAQLTATPEANPTWLALVAAEMEIESGEHAAAARRLAPVTASLPPTDPLWAQAQGLRAMALYQNEEYEPAAESYRSILSQRPDDVATLNNLAYLYVENLGQPDQGLPLAERAARLQPGNEQVLDTLGWAQYHANQPEDAARTLRRSVEARSLAPNHYHLAVVLHHLGDTAGAREHANEAIRLAEPAADEATLEKARQLLQELGQ